MNYITMNRKEREQAKLFEQVKLKVITQLEAAAKLRISDRWVRAKIKRYYESGDAGLTHKNRGRPSPKRWDKAKEAFLIELLKSEWQGFGPTFAAEKLEEIYSIKVSREVIRQIMIRHNIHQPKKRRSKHRKRRERKPMLGIMIQLDGSPHDWFEGRGPRCTLLVFIDDATSRILWLEFVNAESVPALMQATKNYIQKHGIPQSFYTDFGSVFHVNLNNSENIKKTQWERACEQLDIKVNHAHSPQAKGRVERCNQTMQDRLIKEMRLAGISSIEAANNYLCNGDFIEEHNTKFSVKATQAGDAHANHQSFDLDDIFSIQDTRVLANDYTLMYNKRIFQLHDQQRTIIRPKDEITVKVHLDGTLKLWIRKTELYFSEINAKTAQKTSVEKTYRYVPRKPSENSRRWASGQPSIQNCESSNEAGHAGRGGTLNDRNFLPCTKPELFTLL